MAKPKEQASEDQPVEQVTSDHAHAEFEALAALKERYEEAMTHLMAHEARIAELEKHSHNNHTLGAESVQAISDHVMGRVHQTFGHSGMPVRGDQ